MMLFRREWKAGRRSLLFWCIGVFLLMLAGMSKYSAAQASGQAMNDLMNRMPRSLQVIFGTSGFDLSQASGYFGTMFFYLLLLAAAHAVLLGASIIAKEERDKTSEFLFAKPLSRRAIVGWKLAAAFVQALLVNATAWVSSLVSLSLYAPGEALGRPVAELILGLLLVQALFLAASAAIAAGSRRPKQAVAFSGTLLFAAFLLSLLTELSDRLTVLRVFTPFQYVSAHRILNGDGPELGLLGLALVLTALLLALALRGMGKRDLQG
ncbi:ABC transporter permease subunit [Gorillibacterium sp. CAU 1737]|uniref:ABC transporter permease subunit n=1 Tax=Gorillibacterium sp. CAU 1737 TaxID=3140362 RepID=UPI0032614328